MRLENAYCTYKVVYELNEAREKRPLGPKIGEQEAPRVNLRDPTRVRPGGPPPAAPKKNPPQKRGAAQRGGPPKPF